MVHVGEVHKHSERLPATRDNDIEPFIWDGVDEPPKCPDGCGRTLEATGTGSMGCKLGSTFGPSRLPRTRGDRPVASAVASQADPVPPLARG